MGDEEFLSTKKNMTKAIENMQSAVETESKAKAEALRMKKKLESDVLDLESNLERANAANADTQRTIKSYQLNLREAQCKLEDQQRSKEVAHDELINAERKANSNQNALEEARTLLEQADRSRRMVEQELQDTNESLSDSTRTNQAIQGAKMKLESEMQTLQADCDEMDGENRRNADSLKNLRKSERKIKELTYAQEEDRKNHERMQGLIDQLQGKIKSYKKQIEEAEEIAALNLAKYRQVQTNLTGSVERADLNEQALAKSRARARSCSIGPM